MIIHIHFYTLIIYTFYINYTYNYDTTARAEFRSSHWRCSKKTLLLKFLFYKVASFQASNVIKKWLLHWCFPMKYEKFLKTPISKNFCERLLLGIPYIDLYNSLQYRFLIFTNNFFFITQLKRELMTHEATSFE